jgi:hypothetical protein
MIVQADRISFSSYQVLAPSQIKSIQQAQATLTAQIAQSQALDTANDNLFAPVNTLVTQYQNEFNYIDGNTRTTITEQNITDAANRVLNNFFFPNNTQNSVGPLAPNNIWTQTMPFAMCAGIGLPYSGTFPTPSSTGENELITVILAYVSDPGSGVLDPIVNNYIATLNNESTALAANTDTNSGNQAQNTAAANNISNVILPALNSYISSPNFTALQIAVNTRKTFITTRISQLGTILGSITQNISNGSITASSGLYGQRYGYMNLRLNALNGSLTILANLQAANNAQNSTISNIQANSTTYYGILPTSGFQSSANGTASVSLINASFVSPGDSVYVTADNQIEMQLAVKAVAGNSVTLSSAVPSKYTTASNVRLYKDLT